VNLIRLNGWVSEQNIAKLDTWSHPVKDAVACRESEVTGEALYRSVQSADIETQEETQGRTKLCKAADESVVVTKSRPEKAQSGGENRDDPRPGSWGRQKPKALTWCEGRKSI